MAELAGRDIGVHNLSPAAQLRLTYMGDKTNDEILSGLAE